MTDGRSLLAAAEKLRPDVIVIDIAMPQLNGLDAGRKLKQKMPGVKLIYMTMNEDPYLIGEAFRAGASAFLLKQAAGVELIDAIAQVHEGGQIRDAARCGRADEYLAAGAQGPRTCARAKQPRAGSHSTVGRRPHHEGSRCVLKITTRTVAAHKYHAMELLQIKTNAELVQYAIKHRIISV